MVLACTGISLHDALHWISSNESRMQWRYPDATLDILQ